MYTALAGTTHSGHKAGSWNFIIVRTGFSSAILRNKRSRPVWSRRSGEVAGRVALESQHR